MSKKETNMKYKEIELYDTVKIVKGFFNGAECVVISISGDSYTIETKGITLHKDKKEITKM